MKIPFSDRVDDPSDPHFPFADFDKVMGLAAIISQDTKKQLNKEQLIRFCQRSINDELLIKAYDLVFGLIDSKPILPKNIICAST